jgi:hypothetical protein
MRANEGARGIIRSTTAPAMAGTGPGIRGPFWATTCQTSPREAPRLHACACARAAAQTARVKACHASRLARKQQLRGARETHLVQLRPAPPWCCPLAMTPRTARAAAKRSAHGPARTGCIEPAHQERERLAVLHRVSAEEARCELNGSVRVVQRLLVAARAFV